MQVIQLGFNLARKYFGITFIFFATILIGFVYYTYFATILPETAPNNPILLIISILFALWIMWAIGVTFFKSCYVGPGHPPSGLISREELQELRENPNYDSQFRYCKKCHYAKPERTHHDAITNTCILKMDHYW
eukprot:Anaeramoba_ignava/c8138_g1_i2.p1 GENE.c8138_g1_i2~~c8138_g1_i2.p1  ORF type:complete len:134 (+),score=26.23 c8138_g1_i2:9-410(+)